MRYDLKILWVEDTKEFFEEERDILKMSAEELGVALAFEYVENAKIFLEKMEVNASGFKLYDICFVDYNLSQRIFGDVLIKLLRSKRMDSDVLFYSSEYESKIREVIKKDLGAFEGVFTANRDNFEDKANYLINKNARNLTKLSNIRGFLMDQTSENDYTMKSYILRNFDKLSSNEKAEISEFVLDSIKKLVQRFSRNSDILINELETNGINDIKRFMKTMSDIVPLKLKYQIFEKMVIFLEENDFKEISVRQYIDEIVKARNNLAHKKLDICKQQMYIKYYDDIIQFEQRACPETCESHNDDNKYSVRQWNALRKNAQKFGKSMDLIQKRL